MPTIFITPRVVLYQSLLKNNTLFFKCTKNCREALTVDAVSVVWSGLVTIVLTNKRFFKINFRINKST